MCHDDADDADNADDENEDDDEDDDDGDDDDDDTFAILCYKAGQSSAIFSPQSGKAIKARQRHEVLRAPIAKDTLRLPPASAEVYPAMHPP
jgi:hypothetical protein